MPDIDGRSLGGTGEYRGDNTPDNDYPRRDVSIGQEVFELDCEQEGDEWKCLINGETSDAFPFGPNQDMRYSFNDMDLKGAEVDRQRDGDDVRAVYRWPSGATCEMDVPSYNRPDRDEQDKILRCS